MSAVRAEPTLVRICDLAGRPRGSGFLADGCGTVVTSHEAVDGLGRAVVHAPDGRSHIADGDDITPLPEWDLALIRTEELGVPPLVIGAERARAAGTPVRLRTEHRTPSRAGRWTDARLAGTATATYTSTDRFHALEEVLELELPEAASVELRLSRRASGTPVLDADTGAVLAVLGTALHTPRRSAGFAVPLRAAGLLEPDGPLGTLLARNGATVPGFGPDLNLAGALRLTSASVGPAVERAGRPVHRPEVADALRRFEESGASVAGLVGGPGTGRTTELAALASRRSQGVAPAPAVWLRGADLRVGDGSVREAVGRALAEAGSRLDGAEETAGTGRTAGAGGAAGADVVARLARAAKRPLLVLLDAPEEMPPRLAHEMRRWTAGTASWLRASGARMVVAARPEHWEQAGALFPRAMLYGESQGRPEDDAAVTGRGGVAATGQGGTALPPCVRLGDLLPDQAARVRARHGLPEGALAAPEAGHPLAVRMLGEVRTAMADAPPGERRPGSGHAADRPAGEGGPPVPSLPEIFSARLDLACLNIALRLPLAQRHSGRAAAVRRTAARAAGQLHEAARRCLGPGQGALDTPAFEEIFPREGGWESAVLTEGVLVPAGDGFRFADEEFADWLQGRHLELDGALDALLHPRTGPAGPGAAGTAGAGVPRYRIGPVVQALLLSARWEGPPALERRLGRLADACGRAPADGTEAAWWATHLFGETLLRVPDARPYGGVLRALAERIAADGRTGDFGAWFWRRLPLPTADRVELLRLLLPADAPHGGAPRGAGGGGAGERYLDAVSGLLAAEPRTVQPLLCEWFTDLRPLRSRTGGAGASRLTVASAAQALLHTRRGRATDALLDLLADDGHPRAEELLDELTLDEPAALCRAVDRWAHDERAARRAAAARYGVRAVDHARTDAERALLRRAALALLRRPHEHPVHGPALALLVRDPDHREQHLDAALAHLAATGAPELADALARTLGDRPEPVLAAFRERLCEPGSGAHAVLEALADVRTPELGGRIAELVREYAELRPETAGEAVAAFLRRALAHGSGARGALRPLTDALLCTRHAPLRASVARALGTAAGPLRDELLDALLAGEREPAVLDAALEAIVRSVATDAEQHPPGRGAPGTDTPDAEVPRHRQGELVRRIGALMSRTSEGAASFDRRLVELSGEVPGFARRLKAWTAGERAAWTGVLGPGALGVCEAPTDPA